MSLATRGIPLTVTLAISISLLVLVAVAAVLGVGIWSGAKNTKALLGEKAQTIVSTTISRVRTHLGPARNQLEFIQKLIESSQLDLSNRRQLIDIMTGALAAAPQIGAIVYVSPQHQTLIIGRSPEGTRVFERNDSNDPVMQAAMKSARATRGTVWGEPVWRKLPNQIMLNLRLAIEHKYQFAGLLIAAVSVQELSSYLGSLNPQAGGNVFILHDRNKVIAHPSLAGASHPGSKQRSLPSLVQMGDPVLSAIWQRKNRHPLEIIKGIDLKGHVLQIFGDEFIYIYRNVDGFSSKTWQIGTYFRSADVNSEWRRLRYAMIVGLGMLVLALLLAIILARQIAWPIVRLAGSASRIGQLEISETAELPGSIFRELNDQARAFNAMLQGLRWFETYVPKKLVQRLIRQGGNELPASEEREVTVIFTDIAGFTTFSEGIPAPQIAKFLNRHFELLSTCIEKEDGTVDKFIGDSIMAFWGAPDEQSDHAERAVRATQAIVAALEAENRDRVKMGEQAIRVRIGLHSGPATVGNIGSSDRINYTVIGDTVNVAQRIEQSAKDFYKGANYSVVATASGDTVQRLTSTTGLKRLGSYKLRGRDEKTEIYQLN